MNPRILLVVLGVAGVLGAGIALGQDPAASPVEAGDAARALIDKVRLGAKSATPTASKPSADGTVGADAPTEGPSPEADDAPTTIDDGPPIPPKATSGKVAAKPAAKPSDTTMPTKRPEDAEVGRLLYRRSCWQCHGAKGAGDGPAAAAMVGGVPTLVGRVVSRGAENLEHMETLIDVVQDGKGRMPAFQEDIDRGDSRRLLLYVRDLLEGRGATKPTPADDRDGEPAAEGGPEGAGEGD